eukprot:7377885-Prymnesium_polylepis.1
MHAFLPAPSNAPLHKRDRTISDFEEIAQNVRSSVSSACPAQQLVSDSSASSSGASSASADGGSCSSRSNSGINERNVFCDCLKLSHCLQQHVSSRARRTVHETLCTVLHSLHRPPAPAPFRKGRRRGAVAHCRAGKGCEHPLRQTALRPWGVLPRLLRPSEWRAALGAARAEHGASVHFLAGRVPCLEHLYPYRCTCNCVQPRRHLQRSSTCSCPRVLAASPTLIGAARWRSSAASNSARRVIAFCIAGCRGSFEPFG